MEILMNEIQTQQAKERELINSLKVCIDLATQSYSPATCVIARVLLASYNSERFPLDIAELRRLDDQYFTHAMNILRLRHIGYAPHTFFLDGETLFEQLAKDWSA